MQKHAAMALLVVTVACSQGYAQSAVDEFESRVLPAWKEIRSLVSSMQGAFVETISLQQKLVDPTEPDESRCEFRLSEGNVRFDIDSGDARFTLGSNAKYAFDLSVDESRRGTSLDDFHVYNESNDTFLGTRLQIATGSYLRAPLAAIYVHLPLDLFYEDGKLQITKLKQHGNSNIWKAEFLLPKVPEYSIYADLDENRNFAVIRWKLLQPKSVTIGKNTFQSECRGAFPLRIEKKTNRIDGMASEVTICEFDAPSKFNGSPSEFELSEFEFPVPDGVENSIWPRLIAALAALLVIAWIGRRRYGQ